MSLLSSYGEFNGLCSASVDTSRASFFFYRGNVFGLGLIGIV